MRNQSHHRPYKSRYKRFSIKIHDTRKNASQKYMIHKNLSWEEVQYIKFHPHLKVVSIFDHFKKNDNNEPAPVSHKKVAKESIAQALTH